MISQAPPFKVLLDNLALGLEAEPAGALLLCRDAVIRDVLAGMCGDALLCRSWYLLPIYLCAIMTGSSWPSVKPITLPGRTAAEPIRPIVRASVGGFRPGYELDHLGLVPAGRDVTGPQQPVDLAPFRAVDAAAIGAVYPPVTDAELSPAVEIDDVGQFVAEQRGQGLELVVSARRRGRRSPGPWRWPGTRIQAPSPVCSACPTGSGVSVSWPCGGVWLFVPVVESTGAGSRQLWRRVREQFQPVLLSAMLMHGHAVVLAAVARGPSGWPVVHHQVSPAR